MPGAKWCAAPATLGGAPLLGRTHDAVDGDLLALAVKDFHVGGGRRDELSAPTTGNAQCAARRERLCTCVLRVFRRGGHSRQRGCSLAVAVRVVRSRTPEGCC